MAKNVTEVVIAGKIISVSGEEDAAYMAEVAAFINNKMLEMQKMSNYKKLSSELKQILLGLNLADEYFRERKRAKSLLEELENKDQEIYGLKHELINLKLEVERLQKESVKEEA